MTEPTAPIWRFGNKAEREDLEASFQMYVDAYDHTLDDRPPLDFAEWCDMYGADIIREAYQGGRIVDPGQPR